MMKKNALGWPIRIASCHFVSMLLTACCFGSGVLSPPTLAATAVSSPQLDLIMPRGVKRGGEHTLQFSGARLENAEEIFLYDPHGVTVTGITQIDGNKIDVAIRVDENCRLGEHVAQVRTRSGISEFRSFFVGALPAVDEQEPNNSIDEAQPIELNVTVAGVANSEDIDYFKIAGKKGQRVSVEIEAIRLGYMFDPAIALLDKDRFEVAVSDDSTLSKQDGWFSVLLPADGEYYVTARESSFRGNGNSRYRLHVGDFPRPMSVFPAGGKPGETVKLKFMEQLGGEGPGIVQTEKEITLPTEEAFRSGIFYADDRGITPSAIPFLLSGRENVLETEPNNKRDEAQVLTLTDATNGLAVNGVVETEDDQDYFRFAAKQGQLWDLRCHARNIGSGLDPVLNVYDANEKSLMGNDDSGNPDSFVRFPVPADGEYLIRIRDHLKRGRTDFIYRLEISPVPMQLSIDIPRIDRYSQKRQTIAVPQGGRFAVVVNASRQNFAGEIELMKDNLPAGISMTAVPMNKDLANMPVVFEASKDAAIGGSLIDFQARHVDPAIKLTGSFSNLADFALGEPNNRLYYGCTVNRLAVAVIEPLPYQLELIQPKVPLVRDGSIQLKIIAHRDEGFDQPIHCQFPFVSPGVGKTYQITMPKDKSELEYTLNANGNALLGKFPMYVLGLSDVNGQTAVSTQMAELEIADPYVKMDFEQASVELGQATKLYCKLEQLTAFEGEATAEILGIPPNITVNTPLKFTKDTTELSFDVQTTNESPVGKHGLFCQVTIIQNDEPIVARAGNVQLQINKPLPPVEKAKAQP